MNPRLLYLFGRTGLIALLVGLAVLLISSIPYMTLGETQSGSGSSFFPQYEVSSTLVLSPHIGVRIYIQASGPLQALILGISRLEIEDWVSSQFPDLSRFEIWNKMTSPEVINQFLQSHMETILLNATIPGYQSVDYFPWKLTNATVLISNPHNTTGAVSYRISLISALISKDYSTVPSAALIAFGTPLSLLWIAKRRKTYVHSFSKYFKSGASTFFGPS